MRLASLFSGLFAATLLISACQNSKKFVNKTVPNTPAAGFNAAESDTQAIAIADAVMTAMGGRYAWDQTRFLKWTFLNRRMLIWDKKEGRVAIDFLNSDLKIRLNLGNMTGKVWKNGAEMTQADSVKKYLNQGKSIWINDSYWLVMPFKLKDSGVRLKFLGQKPTAAGTTSDVLELTFSNVGDTPDNKYWVYVNPSSHLVTQWDFFAKYTDAKPALSTPWEDYRGLGHILLSVSRGEGRSMAPMGVYEKIPDAVFTTFDPINWSKIK